MGPREDNQAARLRRRFFCVERGQYGCFFSFLDIRGKFSRETGGFADLITAKDGVFRLMVEGLNAAALRQRVTAHNLANINTPNFKRSYVVFEDNLRRAMDNERIRMKLTHSGHRPGPGGMPSPQVKTRGGTVRREDGNNVDLEKEMLEMVGNQIRYNALAQQISERFNSWRYVINEGRR